MNELETSITVVQGCLIVTFPNEMTYTEIELGCNKILMEASKLSIFGALFDLSNVTILDSYAFNALKKTSKAISFLGITIVWSGLRPAVVSSLLDLNVDVRSIKTALNLEEGLKVISKNRGAM